MLVIYKLCCFSSVAYAVLKNTELIARIQHGKILSYELKQHFICHLSLDLANARCILTANVAKIGETTFKLKYNVEDALKQINQKSLRRCKSGSQPGSVSSLNTPASNDSRKASMNSESGLPEIDQDHRSRVVQTPDIEQEKFPPFTVLVASQYYAETNSSLPQSDNCSYFDLEEVSRTS